MSRRSLPEMGMQFSAFVASKTRASARRTAGHGFPGPCRGFAIFHDCLPCSIPSSCEGGIPPLGHARMCPSRSVSNNYHATNHQPIRNTGAKKETSSDGAEWRTRCRCASVASPSRHMGHTLRVQNDDGAEFVVERGVAVYGVSVARTGCKRKLQPRKRRFLCGNAWPIRKRPPHTRWPRNPTGISAVRLRG